MNIYFSTPSLPVIIAIVGPSGSGKTTMARTMNQCGIPMIVSYTTRPMRKGEVNGVDHWFVDSSVKPDESEMLAYTQFGGYEYWATTRQIRNLCVYVIDEKGLLYLKERFGNRFVIFSIYLDREQSLRMESEVSEERCNRDNDRQTLAYKQYDYVIQNIYPLDDFIRRIQQFTMDLLKDYGNNRR